MFLRVVTAPTDNDDETRQTLPSAALSMCLRQTMSLPMLRAPPAPVFFLYLYSHSQALRPSAVVLTAAGVALNNVCAVLFCIASRERKLCCKTRCHAFGLRAVTPRFVSTLLSSIALG